MIRTQDKSKLVFLFSAIFFCIAEILLLTKYFGYFMPAMMLLAIISTGLIIHLNGIESAFKWLLFLLPLSVNYSITAGSSISIPGEPFIIAVSLAVILRYLSGETNFTSFLKHPATILLLLFIFWNIISIFSSEILVVSVKAVIIKILYVTCFYIGGFAFFSSPDSSAGFKPFLFSLVMVSLFIVWVHSQYGFSKDTAGYVTKPFFSDHTIYSAALAFMIPLTLSYVINTKGSSKWGFAMLFIYLLIAVVLSSSRAAWVSIAIMLLFLLIISLKIKISTIAFSFLLIAGAGLYFSDDLISELKLNRSDSNAKNADIETQTLSVANISNDDSNAERLNRWKCALRMTNEKPLTGFGPGTYQFVYFPFQRDYEMTRISVTSPYNIKEGRGGTAHHEYLLVASEAGIPAALFFVLFVLTIIITGIRNCYQSSGAEKIVNTGILCALITYVVHGFFNNFLDTASTAVLFYGAAAFITGVAIKRKSNAQTE